MVKSRTWWPRKNSGTTRASAGFHRMLAMPMKATINPRVTTIWVLTAAPWRWRISSRSIRKPSIGAAIPRMRINASHCGQPSFTVSSQKPKAHSMPMAPWAKLKMPDVV